MALAADAASLIDSLDLLLCTRQMSATRRQRLLTMVNAIPATDKTRRVKSALLVLAISPDFAIQK